MISITKGWDKESKVIYYLFLSIFSISIIYFSAKLFLGTENYFEWKTISEISKIKVPIDNFEVGIFQYSIESDVYLALQTFFGGDVIMKSEITFLSFGIITLLILTILTTLSFLNNFIYYLGTFFCLSYFMLQQPNILFEDFNYNTIILIAPIIIFGGLSYYFFAFSNSTSFLLRIVSFIIIAIIYYGVLFSFTKLNSGVYYIFSYASIGAILLSILFIAFVAFEIVLGLLKLVSINEIKGQNQSNSLHFIVIFLLYMTNLILQYLKNSNKINFELLPISPFIILIISSLLGIYGFKDRSLMFKNILPFYPFGAVIYICWSSFCFITISYFFVTGNDAIIEVFEDAIHLTHIGFGIGFFMYVALNYRSWVSEKLPISKAIYTHQNVSFYSVYGTGTIIVLSMFFYNSMFAYNQTMAGWYAQIADAYMYDNDEILSEEYYGKSLRFEFQNHKSNYSLAMIYKNRNNLKDARYLYEKAQLKKPTPFAYANSAQLYLAENQVLEAMFRLKKGIETFPKSAELKSNLALVFEKLNMSDSAVYYLNKSLSCKVLNENKANKIALIVKKKSLISDTTQLNINIKNKELITNILAYKIVHKKNSENIVNYLIDSSLTDINHAYIQNYHLLNLSNFDSTKIGIIDYLILNDTLNTYKNDLIFLKSMKQYYGGNKLTALKSIDHLQLGNEETAGKYLNTLGIWALQLKLNKMATQIFQLSSNKGDKTSRLNYAISLSELGNEMEVIKNLKEIEKTDSSAKEILNFFGSIYSSKTSKVLLESDDYKFKYLYYKNLNLSDSECGNIFFSIKNSSLKFQSAQILFYKYFNTNTLNRCAYILNETNKLDLTVSEKLKFNTMKIKFFVAKNDIESLEKELNNSQNSNYLPFLKGFLAYKKNSKIDCETHYNTALMTLQFDEQIMLEIAKYYSNINIHEKSYQILLEAITINPYSLALYKAYTLESLAFGIPSFAESGLKKVEELSSKFEFEKFKITYQIEKNKLNNLQ